MSALVSPLKSTTSTMATPLRMSDAQGVGEPVAAERELAGHQVVLGEDRGEPGEGVVGGVRGEDEDERRERLEQVEADGVGAEHGAVATWATTVWCSLGTMPKRIRDEGDAHEQHGQQDRHDRQRRRRVARLRAS